MILLRDILRSIMMKKDNLVYEFFSSLNSALKRRVRIVAIGGNALSLLGIKEHTKDIDVCISSDDRDVKQFCIDYTKKYKVPVHFFVDGLFKNVRVKDYFEKSYPLDLPEFPNLEVRVFNIYDIVLTKINRYAHEDKEDLEKVLKLYKLNDEDLNKRFKQYLKFYMGPKEKFIKDYKKFKKKLNSKKA